MQNVPNFNLHGLAVELDWGDGRGLVGPAKRRRRRGNRWWSGIHLIVAAAQLDRGLAEASLWAAQDVPLWGNSGLPVRRVEGPKHRDCVARRNTLSCSSRINTFSCFPPPPPPSTRGRRKQTVGENLNLVFLLPFVFFLVQNCAYFFPIEHSLLLCPMILANGKTRQLPLRRILFMWPI